MEAPSLPYLECADGEDELAGEVSELREEGVEEEGEDQAEDGNAEADGVHVVLHHGLHVHLQRKYSVIRLMVLLSKSNMSRVTCGEARRSITPHWPPSSPEESHPMHLHCKHQHVLHHSPC